MIFTSPMRLLAAVVRQADSDAIARELLRQGALEMVSPRELAGDWGASLSAGDPGAALDRLTEARKRVELFMGMATPPLERPALDGSEVGIGDDGDGIGLAEKRLDAIAADVSGLRERQKVIQDEILKLDEMRRQVEAFGDLKAASAASGAYSFLSIRAGLLPSAQEKALSSALDGMPYVIVPSSGEAAASGERPIVLLSLKRDAQRVETALQSLGWRDARLPDAGKDGKAALDSLDARMDELRARQRACGAELGEYFGRVGPELASLWAAIRVKELVGTVRSRFSRTERTVLFSGWIPAERAAEVEAGIRGAAEGGVSLQWMEPGSGETKALQAPVAMRNPAPLRPFEGLVRNYAVPEYGAVDPTPFVAVAYLCMFGLMFGDAGHGLVVALIGLIGLWKARKGGKPDGLFKIIAYCGGAAIVAGVLFGSYFGMGLFPPLWFDYHGIVNGHGGSGAVRSVYDILGITIRFGMVVLGAGFIINWVNLARKGEWLTLCLDKAGLAGGWIYGAGAWAAFYYVGTGYRELPPGDLLFFLLGLPTMALGLKAPLEFIHERRHGGKRFKPAMVMDFTMEWIVEILEVYSGYLANTLSFMRVAGLGIAHVSLMTAFFQIARMISPEGPLSPVAILVLALGNALVIALEGLSAGIQSLRLNYYEFFSKYFNGTGKAYRPISLSGA